jgi:DNA-binding transcriptional ArsR family regulator
MTVNDDCRCAPTQSDGGSEEAYWILITLHNSQVKRVLANVVNGTGLQGYVLGRIGELDWLEDRLASEFAQSNPGISQSVLRALQIVHALLLGRERAAAEIAGELGLAPSSVQRYMRTLEIVGLVERGPTSKYRLVAGASGLSVA